MVVATSHEVDKNASRHHVINILYFGQVIQECSKLHSLIEFDFQK